MYYMRLCFLEYLYHLCWCCIVVLLLYMIRGKEINSRRILISSLILQSVCVRQGEIFDLTHTLQNFRQFKISLSTARVEIGGGVHKRRNPGFLIFTKSGNFFGKCHFEEYGNLMRNFPFIM